MSLERPLAQSLVNSLVKPLAGYASGYYAALAALVEKWPLKSSLIGSEGTPITLTRASAAIYLNVFGKYEKQAINEPSYGAGLYIDPAITNKGVNYNLNPTDLTGVTSAGSGAFSAADMSAFLANTSFSTLLSDADINGNMIKLDNTGAGGDSSISFNGAAANTNKHSLKVFVYVESGTATVRRSSTATGAVALTASSELQEVVIEGFTADAADLVQVVAADNAIIYAFANMLTETATAPNSIIECAGASGTQALTDVQAPTYADNFQDWSEDFTEWSELKGAVYDASDGSLTFNDVGASRLRLGNSEYLAAAGLELTLWLRVKAGTSSAVRLTTNDGVSQTTTADLPLTSEYTWVSKTFTVDASPTMLRTDIRVESAATAGSVFIDKTILTTSPILPKYLETTGSAITTPQNAFQINDGSYLIFLPQGIVDSGANQGLLESFVDANNYIRVIYTGTAIVVNMVVSGALTQLVAGYTSGSGALALMITNHSVNGKVLMLSSGLSDTDPNTDDFQLNSIMQIGNRESLGLPASIQAANLARFDEVITDINAAIQASEYGK